MFFMVAFFVVFSSIRVQYGYIESPDYHIMKNKPEEYIELKIEPIEMVEQRMNATGEVKNAANDENSNGAASSNQNQSSGNNQESYHSSRSLQDVEQSVRDLEKSFYNETGGAQRREEIQKEMDQRKKEQAEKDKNKANNNSGSTTKTAGNSTKGNVLVSYNLKDRSGQYVPAPGYMCPQGTTGKVIINIKVDGSGKVIDAKVNPSSASTECMNSYALDFARKSKFNFSSTVNSQEGTITYTFVN